MRKKRAIYLLMDAWQAEAKQGYLDCFHWINDVGTLSVAEIQAIAKKVWPECPDIEEDFLYPSKIRCVGTAIL